MDKAQHGTAGSYKRGCKCDKCKAAWAAYMRSWAAKNKDLVAASKTRTWQRLTPEQREERREYMRQYIAERPVQQRLAKERKWEWRSDPENRALEAAQAREARKKDPERIALNSRRYLLKKQYGITLEQYDEMVESQGGCGICGG